jgi:hypothetical protein
MNEKSNLKFGVFIIESLAFEDEDDARSDGQALHEMLRLIGIDSRYEYIRTERELEAIMERFDDSHFKHLHFSCHGSNRRVHLTLDELDFKKFGELVGPHLEDRRLFISACNVAQFDLAKHIVPRFRCHSVIGSPKTIEFGTAAVFWSAFYYKMFKTNDITMKQRDLRPILKELTAVFNLELRYFSIIGRQYKTGIDHLREFHIKNGKEVFDKSKLTPYQKNNPNPFDPHFSIMAENHYH